MKFDARKKRMIDKCLAAKEGGRFHAFYRGVRDWQNGKHENPYPTGSEHAQCWSNGQKYMEDGN